LLQTADDNDEEVHAIFLACVTVGRTRVYCLR
jgi:hypothetical protein